MPKGVPHPAKLKQLEKAPDIWNENSPLVTIIGQRYERAGLHTWNNARVSALARALQKTIWVLCAEAGFWRIMYDVRHDLFRVVIDRPLIRKTWKANHWPVWAALHFDRFERYVKTQKLEAGATLLAVADGAAAKVLH